MKNIKNIVLSILSIVTIITSANIGATPTFELYNKANQPIGVIIQESGWPRRENHIIEPKQQLSLDINIAHILHIFIFENTNTPEELQHKNDSEAQRFRIHALGKRTAYLTWNPAKAPYLYPQTGPWLGYLGRTESGWPLNKKTNINQHQIQ
jgi:hypothetical protein